MEKIEKITIKLVMLLIGFSLLFPARALGSGENGINEITEKKADYIFAGCKQINAGRRTVD